MAGPAKSDALPLDERARQLFAYFKHYNYEVMETGETIRFAGTYKASRGQAAALIFYVFCGGSLSPNRESVESSHTSDPLCSCIAHGKAMQTILER